MITDARLRISGWLSIAMGVLTIPIILISALAGLAAGLGSLSEELSRSATAVLTAINFVLFAYVYSSLRHLLESRHAFTGTSGLIRWMILINLVLVAATIANIVVAALDTPVMILSVVGILILGIMFVVFGIKLLQLDDSLGGMLKPYSYTAIVTGVCYASILLIPVGILVGIANDIILALLFFNAAKVNAPNQTIEPTGDTRAGFSSRSE